MLDNVRWMEDARVKKLVHWDDAKADIKELVIFQLLEVIIQPIVNLCSVTSQQLNPIDNSVYRVNTLTCIVNLISLYEHTDTTIAALQDKVPGCISLSLSFALFLYSSLYLSLSLSLSLSSIYLPVSTFLFSLVATLFSLLSMLYTCSCLIQIEEEVNNLTQYQTEHIIKTVQLPPLEVATSQRLSITANHIDQVQGLNVFNLFLYNCFEQLDYSG